MHTVLYLTFIRGKHHKLAFTLKPVIIRRDRSDPRLKRHTGHSRREGVMFSLFIDWRSWWGPIMHFGRRAGKCTEVVPTRVCGGDDVAALHRYSMRGFTLSCTVKVCVPLWGGRDRVMDDTRLYARRDSTAGPLNDRGAWPSTHLPILGRAGDLMGRKKTPLPRSMDRCSGEKTAETAVLQGPLCFSPLTSNWKSCKRSILWYCLSLSASHSFKPEHDKNNTD